MRKRFYMQKTSLLCLAVILLLLISSIVGSLFVNEEGRRISLGRRSQPPSAENILGTDPAGRDMLGQLVIGMRNSLFIAIAITVTTSIFGTSFGLTAGYFGGKTDMALMRFLDFVSILPRLMLIIVFVALVPNFGAVSLVLILSCLGWMYDARIIRGRVLTLRDEDFIRAAKVMGTPAPRIMIRHLLPHLLPIIIVNFTLNLAGNIGVETGLSLLGFGLPFSTPSLGTLLNYARIPENLHGRLWLWLPAAILIFIVMICVHSVGRMLRRSTKND